jgi:hypothetical protein
MNLNKNMENKFQHNHSLLLHVIYEAYKNDQITQNQKIKLKGTKKTFK